MFAAFLPLIFQLLPQLAKIFSSTGDTTAHENLAQALKNVVQTDDPKEAQVKLDNDPELKLQAQQALAAAALAELQEQDRAKEQQRQIDLAFYQDELAEKDKIRQDDFEYYMKDLQDRQAARSNYMQLAEEKNPLAWVGPFLAVVLMGLIFYCLRSILVAREPIENKDVFNTVLGALVTAFTTVISFYFGSSASSKKKDDLVASGVLVSNTNNVPPIQTSPPTTGGTGPPPSPGQPGGSTANSQVIKSTSVTGVLKTFAEKAPMIMNRLMAQFGISVPQAAGILGNLGHESGGFLKLQEIHPLAGAGGFGWAQWTGSRRTAYLNWCAANGNLDPRSDEANYGFLAHELQTTQASSLQSLKRTQTLAAATADFMHKFEVPAVRYENLDSRLKFANLALREYGRVYSA